MSLSNSIARLADYWRRHGITATMRRLGVAGKRTLFASRMVVFYCDLDAQRLKPVGTSKTFVVKRIESVCELSPQHLHDITDFWNTTLALRNIEERFEKGAALWLVEFEGSVAGYGWTIAGRPISPYYFPLGLDDVQLFDFYVFPRFRGRALHWLLTRHILHSLACEGRARAFADTAEWNQAQLASFKLTPFRFLGYVKTYRLFGHLLSAWVADEAADSNVRSKRSGREISNQAAQHEQ